jgi:hypothetical protein
MFGEPVAAGVWQTGKSAEEGRRDVGGCAHREGNDVPGQQHHQCSAAERRGSAKPVDFAIL